MDMVESNVVARVPLARQEKKIRPPLERDDVARMLASLDRSSFSGCRDFALVLFLLDSGARVSECRAVRFEEVEWDEGRVLVRGKGQKQRYVGVTKHPTAEWVWRQLIEATAWGRGPRFVIRDRDRSYGGNFIPRARAIGIETVLTPVCAPQANAIAERLVGTLRRECTDHIIPLNERHLRRLLREYVGYYNETRPHRTLELEPPEGARDIQRTGCVVADPVLGGVHHRYRREAA